MGEVFRARDAVSGGRVAVKVMRNAAAGHARFRLEANMLASMHHPGVVRYVDHGVTDAGHCYLAMEWLDGPSLADVLRGGALGVDDSLRLAWVMAEALAAVHAHGIVHRDLKPSNIVLEGGRLDSLRILDFGVALLADAQRVTDDGTLVGTPGYMAPEQARGMPDIDSRADIFSLGCILYESLSGRPAFAGAHPFAIISKVMTEDPPALGVSEDLDRLVMAMMVKEPRGRLPSAHALGEWLEAVSDPSLRQRIRVA